jgi:glycosyltransferase involved in cell wall biosynthesis
VQVLFINRCYWPDVEATGQLLTELCSDLARDQRVTVITGRPNYGVPAGQERLLRQQTHDGVDIVRVGNRRFDKTSFLGRAVGLLSFLLLAAWAALLRRRPDVIVVETDPPLLGALGVLLRWWHRCPLVFYLQDLYPEVGLALGRLRPGLLTGLLRWTTQAGLRGADRVVVLGEDMRRRVLERGIAAAKVDIVPNWADTRTVCPARANNPIRRDWQLNGEFTVMYSGNLGFTQSLDSVLVAARELREEPALFLLVGDGAAKKELMNRAAAWALDKVRFFPYQPRERLADSLSAGDLHLIPLRRGLAGTIVPSKLYGILAAGAPYIAAVDADSDVARVTKEGGTGILIEPESPQQLVAALRWAMAHRGELRAMGQAGRRLAETQFDRQTAVAAFARVLTRVAKARRRGSMPDGALDRSPAKGPKRIPAPALPIETKGRRS